MQVRRAPDAAPWDKTLESWNPVAVAVLATLGAVGAVALLLAGADRTATSAAFVDSGGFPLWAAAIAAQSAVWAVVTVPLWREVVRLVRTSRPSPAIWLVPALIVLALATLAVASPAARFVWPLVGHHAKVWVLTALAAAGVGLPALFGMCLVQDRVRRHRPETVSTADIELALTSKERLRRYLAVAGAIIGLAVLASGALRLATVPAFLDESVFPQSAVLLYGAFFTALLLLVYVPAYLSLRRLCLDIREHYYPLAEMPPPTGEEFAAWVAGRARLDALTQVEVTAGQQLRAALFILAPLLSGVFTALLPPPS